MTDKERIIIHGIDVSKCDFSLDCIGIICQLKNGRTDKCNCSDYPNCYFKQLQRSVVRIKDLEERIIKHSAVVEEYCSRLADKEQECEQIKEKYEALKLENQEGYEIVAELKHECEEYKKQLEFVRTHRSVIDAERNRYRKALEEIEEVIKSPCAEDCVYYEPSRCYDCIKTSILDIINKAKGEGNGALH